jgi:hypothetical protein
VYSFPFAFLHYIILTFDYFAFIIASYFACSRPKVRQATVRDGFVRTVSRPATGHWAVESAYE